MEQQVLSLLQATLTPDTTTVSNAEQALKGLYNQPEYPFALLSLATHSNVSAGLRKSSLTNLRQYVESTWSPQLESFSGSIFLNDEAKSQLRSNILALCTTSDSTIDTSLQRLASQIVAKIASVDFPDNWPALFPEVINTLKSATHDAPAQGTLRVLLEMVDSGLSEAQFFAVAPDVINTLQHITENTQLTPIVKASALNVLRSCFESLELVLESENGPSARAFLDGSLKQWMPFFMHVLRQPLPDVTQEDFDKGSMNITNKWKGDVAVKTQSIKVR